MGCLALFSLSFMGPHIQTSDINSKLGNTCKHSDTAQALQDCTVSHAGFHTRCHSVLHPWLHTQPPYMPGAHTDNSVSDT